MTRFPVLLTASLLISSLPAQIETRDPLQRLRESMLQEQQRLREERARQIEQYTFPFSALPKEAPLPFHLGFRPGIQQVFPFYDGLPTYPSNVPGYGGYPGVGTDADPSASTPTRIPPSMGGLEKPPADKDAWPSWIEEGAGAAGMRATPQQAVLVRGVDRVWFRAATEPTFVPLVFHDRFRFMTVGSQVEVRGRGEFQMVMHTGGSVKSQGTCSLAVAGMDANEVVLKIRDVDKAWIHAGLRPFRVELPDGSEVTFTDTVLHLRRVGNRCRVANMGNSPIQFVGSAGRGELEGPTYLDVWMNPPKRPPMGHALAVRGDVAKSTNQGITSVRGGADGEVIYSGAMFRVGSGSNLEIKPLAPARVSR